MIVTLILAALVIAPAAFWLTQAARSIEPVKSWALTGRKPWACDFCCATWSSLIVTIVLAVVVENLDLVLAWPSAAGLTFLISTWYAGRAAPIADKSTESMT